MTTPQLFRVVKLIDKYPLPLILAKHFVANGITEADFQRLVKVMEISQPLALSIQNSIRDIQTGFITKKVLDQIPHDFLSMNVW